MRWFLTYPENAVAVAAYRRWVERGGVDVAMAPEAAEQCDDLLLTGGGDVDPIRYGDASRHPSTYGVDVLRDVGEVNSAHHQAVLEYWVSVAAERCAADPSRRRR